MARKPKRSSLSLAPDRSKRPIRGTPHGDIVTGKCEALSCGIELCRGDDFRTLLGDILICVKCYESNAPLTPRIIAVPQFCIAGTRAKRGGRPRKKEQLAALRRARTEQLIAGG